MTNVQYLTDSQGVRTSVVISISDWNKLSKYVEELNLLDEIGESIRSGIKEAKSIESGAVVISESNNDFLDAL
jgi:hypothetical protein